MLDLVIGVSVRAWSKWANSTATIHLDGHAAYTLIGHGISTNSTDTNEALYLGRKAFKPSMKIPAREDLPRLIARVAGWAGGSGWRLGERFRHSCRPMAEGGEAGGQIPDMLGD